MKINTFNHLWLPARQNTSKTLLILHGRGDSYHGFEWFVNELGISSINYLLINAPDEYYFGYSWYDLPPEQLPGINRSRKLLDQLFQELDQQGIRSNDVLMFGFSQGCLMCLEWGGRTHHQLAGFIGISGYCYDPIVLGKELSDTAKNTPWLVTHGYDDDLLPYHETKSHVETIISSGLPIDFYSYSKGHTIDLNEEFPLIQQSIRKMFNL